MKQVPSLYQVPDRAISTRFVRTPIHTEFLIKEQMLIKASPLQLF